MIVAVLDACVLYPPSVRDLLMRIAESRLYSPRWILGIEAEWVRNALANNTDISVSKLARTCELMKIVEPDAVVTGHEVHISGLALPDPDDRHVLAAAIHSGSSHIVTYNLSDFPASVLATHNMRVTHPDTFLTALAEQNIELFIQTVRNHRAALKNPPKTPREYIDTLVANRLNSLASRLEARLNEF